MKSIRIFLAAMFAMLGVNAFAVGPDFSTLTAGIDFTTAAAAVLAGYVLLAAFGLVVRGGEIILRKLGLKV